jgi:hypothetical protein
MMPMKSESREEAAARLKELSKAERSGMDSATEGQLQAVLRTPEMDARAEAIDEYGDALLAAQDVLDENPFVPAEEEPAIDASGNRTSGKRRSAKKSAKRSGAGKGRRSARNRSEAGGEPQPQA